MSEASHHRIANHKRGSLPVLLLLPWLIRIEVSIRRALRIANLGSLARRLVLLRLLTLRSGSRRGTKPVSSIECALALLCACPSLRRLANTSLTNADAANASTNVLGSSVGCIWLICCFWRTTSRALADWGTCRWSSALAKTHESLHALARTI